MASLYSLWSNRAKFPIGSKEFLRAWGKRFFTFPELLIKQIRRFHLIKKGAKIHKSAEIGKIEVGGNLALLSVGQSTFLGRVKISLHDKVIIGNKVCINDNVEILTGSHDVNDSEWKLIARKVQIEDFVWIGTGAMVLPGVNIGRGAIVGARAVVSKNVPSGAIVVGNPARQISKFRPNELNYNPSEFLAANSAWLRG